LKVKLLKTTKRSDNNSSKLSLILKINQKDNHGESRIENILCIKNDLKISNSLVNSGVGSTIFNSKSDNTINSIKKESNKKFNINNKVKNDNNKINCNDNSKNIDVYYYEKELSINEEFKLKNAISNHFIFNDLNEDIM